MSGSPVQKMSDDDEPIERLEHIGQMVENLAYEIAGDCPSPLVSELILIAAQMDDIRTRLEPHLAKAHRRLS